MVEGWFEFSPKLVDRVAELVQARYWSNRDHSCLLCFGVAGDRERGLFPHAHLRAQLT